MEPVISDLVRFLRDREVPSSLKSAVEEVGLEQAVGIASRIIALLMQGSYCTEESVVGRLLHLEREARTVQFLAKLPDLSGVVLYDGASHRLRNILGEPDRSSIAACIRRDYLPRLHFKPREEKGE